MKALIDFRFTNIHNESGRMTQEFNSIKDAVNWCKKTLAPAESRFRTFEVRIFPDHYWKRSTAFVVKYSHLYRKLGDWCDPYFEY